MAIDWSNYVDGGGIGVPRFELRNLDDSATETTIDLTIIATTPYGEVTSRPERTSATYIPLNIKTPPTPQGTIYKKTRGFRYYENLLIKLMSLSNLANVKAILNHDYKIKYYPNYDNLNRWCYVIVDGSFNWLNENQQLPLYTANLIVTGTHTVDAIPHDGTVQKVLNHAQWTLGNFSAAEEERALRALNHTQWNLGNFSASEMLRGRIPQTMGKAYKDGYVSANV